MSNDFIPDDQFQPDDEVDRDPASIQAPAPAPTPDPTASQTPTPAPSASTDDESPEPSQPAPDFVPDAQFTPDAEPQNAADFVPDSQFQPDDETYSTPTEETKGYAEAVGRGLIGPLAPLAEEQLFGVSPQAIAGRESALGPSGQLTEAATFAGSMFLGAGEAALFSKIGKAAAEAADCGKLASSFIKNTAEMGLFIGSNKAEKAAMGTLDPQETSANALAQDGAVAILGGTGGTAIESIATPVLQKIADSQIGSKASQFLSNFGSRLKFWQSGGGDMASALTDQMENVHANIAAARESAFGPTGVKARNIQLLTQEDGITPDQANQHLSTVTSALSDLPDELLNDPMANRAITTFKNAVDTPIDPITLQPTISPKSPADIFLATDQLKRDMGYIADFGQNIAPSSTGNVVSGQARDLYGVLKNSLEDQDVWGRSAELQQGLNSAFTAFKPNNDNFISKFTEKDFTDPNRVVSPGRVNTYVNQLGKPAAEIKQDMVGGWVNSYENYANEVNALHARLGLETPLVAAPTDLIKQSAQQTDAGGDLADRFYNFHVNKLASHTVNGLVMGAIGEKEGGWKGALAGGAASFFMPSLEDAFGRTIRNSAVPYIVRALSSGAPETLGSVLRYGESAAKGAAKISTGINALFKAGGTQAVDAYASDRDRDRLDDYVSSGELNQQLQEQVQAPPPTPRAPQHFAEGGEVKNPQNGPTPTYPIQPVLKSVSGIAKAMPDHAAVLAGAKVRVANYLNSVRPQEAPPKFALDRQPRATDEQRRSYQKALDLAVQPLGILNHIQDGTLTLERLNHFKSMWPELHDHLSKKLTERITQAQVEGERPSRRVRQTLSMFLGAPMEANLSPQSIQAIQALYAPKPATPAPGVPPKKQTKNTSKLGEISKDHFTQDQASAQRATTWS